MTLRARMIGQTSLSVSEIGFGAAPLGNLFGVVSDEEAEATLEAAWAAGIRYFDTAPLYGFGLSEERLGRFLQTKPRDAFVVSTKAGRLLKPNAGWHAQREFFIDAGVFEPVFDYSHDGVLRAFESSLDRLGLDRIDLLLMHDIGAATHGDAHRDLMKVAMEGGGRALQSLRREGQVKAIGLGVNEWQVCAEAMEHGRWDAFLLAGRYTLLEQEPLQSFFPMCEREGIGIVVGGPFNSGILATGAVDGAHFNYGAAPADVLARVRRMDAVCRAHGVPLPAAALQFPLAHPLVAAVIPGVADRHQLAAALSHAQIEIPVAFWSDLKGEGLLPEDAPVPGEARP